MYVQVLDFCVFAFNIIAYNSYFIFQFQVVVKLYINFRKLIRIDSFIYNHGEIIKYLIVHFYLLTTTVAAVEEAFQG